MIKKILTSLFVLSLFYVGFAPHFVGADCTITTTTGTTNAWEFGFNTDVQKQAQSFTPLCTGTITQITFNVDKHGTPSDTTTFSIYSDSAGTVGSSLGSATKDGSTFGTSPADVTLTLGSGVAVVNGTQYWFVMERTLAGIDGVNYYPIQGDATLTYGHWRKWASGTWVSQDFQTARFSAVITAAQSGIVNSVFYFSQF